MLKKIIFTHVKPDIWQYKAASALRKKGIKTISISLLKFDRKMFSNAFDEIICLDFPNLKPKTLLKEIVKKPFNFIKFFYKLFSVKADAAICQGAPHYLSAFFIWFFKGKFQRIYFPYDFIFSKVDDPEKYSPRREVWGEKYSFRNCNALVCKSEKEELNLLPKWLDVSSKPVLSFPCYALSEWFCPYQPKKKLSYFDKEVHIVYPGAISDSPLYKPMTTVFSDIIKQKIHIHLYCPLSSLNNKRIFEIIGKNKEFKNYLHIHKFVLPNKLSEEISKYDFGYHSSGHTKIVKPEAVKFETGNKMSSYLEAGIPIIVKKEQWATSRIVDENQIGISVENMKNLKKHLKGFNYAKAIKNIHKFRKNYAVEEHINELIKFIYSLKAGNIT